MQREDKAGVRMVLRRLGMWLMVCCMLWLAAGGSAGGLVSYGAEQRVFDQAVQLSGDGTGEQRVFDQAGLFDSDMVEALEKEIGRLREQMNMDVVLVTTDDADGKSAGDYADDFYDQGGFGTGKDASGVLYLIDMDNREVYISTAGAMIRFLTDKRIDSMLDRAVERLSAKAYGSAAWRLLEDTQYWYEKGIPGGQYNYDVETGTVSRHRSIRWYEALAALAAAAVCAGSACLAVRREYAMKQERSQASNFALAYRAGARFTLQDPKDVMVHSFVTQKMIPRVTVTGGGRGGGYRGSSGRSSTHRSGGGRSHGGGGRRF